MHRFKELFEDRIRPALAILLVIPVATGVMVLMDILPGAFAALPAVVAAAAVAIRIADQRDLAARFPLIATALHVGARLVRWLGAIVVPLMALLGFNWYVAKLGGRPNPLVGMGVAALIIGAVVYVYLHPWWVSPRSRHPGRWAIATTVVLVLIAAGAGAWQATKREDPAANGEAVSDLELVVVGAGPGFPRIDPPTEETGWTVNTWRGRADGDTVVWDDAGPPPRRPEHDRVLLLDVDPQGGDDPDRWAAVARAAGRNGATTFALLRSGDDARVLRWREKFRPASETRPGDVVKLSGPLADRTTGDLALRLVARAPTAEEDLALAGRHRPILLFHKGGGGNSREQTPVPLNIDRLIEAEQFRLCSTKQVIVGNCANVDESRDIVNGSNYLEFNTRKLAEHTDGTTIYVHVTDHEGLKYLDYWWYLPDNPSNAGGGALCGAGLVVAGITCHDHQSDWEGVTVVVDPWTGPVSVVYAGHKHRTRYTWSDLERLWARGYTETVARDNRKPGRPLVFIARGTHAAYPTGCPRRCSDPVTGQNEESHDGRLTWPGAREPECVALCLTALPTTDQGRRPARWNAYNGRWGTANCELIVFCSSTDPPASPAQQRRYQRPWCPTGGGVVVGNRVERERNFGPPPGCR